MADPTTLYCRNCGDEVIEYERIADGSNRYWHLWAFEENARIREENAMASVDARRRSYVTGEFCLYASWERHHGYAAPPQGMVSRAECTRAYTPPPSAAADGPPPPISDLLGEVPRENEERTSCMMQKRDIVFRGKGYINHGIEEA